MSNQETQEEFDVCAFFHCEEDGVFEVTDEEGDVAGICVNHIAEFYRPDCKVKDLRGFEDHDYSLLEPKPFKLGPVDPQQQNTGCDSGRKPMSNEEFCKLLAWQQCKRG